MRYILGGIPEQTKSEILRKSLIRELPKRGSSLQWSTKGYVVPRMFREAAEELSNESCSVRMYKSSHWKSFSIQHWCCFSCESAGASWKVQLFKPAALRSCDVFENLYSYFWWIPSFASSCIEWESIWCLVGQFRLTIRVIMNCSRECLKSVMKVEFCALMLYCMTQPHTEFQIRM
jgi:hypothetical protein